MRLFVVYESPAFNVWGCEEKLAQESRGLMGCHDFTSCPNCVVEPLGFELWGENGHRQGGGSQPITKKQAAWRKFLVKQAGPIYYKGGWKTGGKSRQKGSHVPNNETGRL